MSSSPSDSSYKSSSTPEDDSASPSSIQEDDSALKGFAERYDSKGFRSFKSRVVGASGRPRRPRKPRRPPWADEWQFQPVIGQWDPDDTSRLTAGEGSETGTTTGGRDATMTRDTDSTGTGTTGLETATASRDAANTRDTLGRQTIEADRLAIERLVTNEGEATRAQSRSAIAFRRSDPSSLIAISFQPSDQESHEPSGKACSVTVVTPDTNSPGTFKASRYLCGSQDASARQGFSRMSGLLPWRPPMTEEQQDYVFKNTVLTLMDSAGVEAKEVREALHQSSRGTRRGQERGRLRGRRGRGRGVTTSVTGTRTEPTETRTGTGDTRTLLPPSDVTLAEWMGL